MTYTLVCRDMTDLNRNGSVLPSVEKQKKKDCNLFDTPKKKGVRSNNMESTEMNSCVNNRRNTQYEC